MQDHRVSVNSVNPSRSRSPQRARCVQRIRPAALCPEVHDATAAEREPRDTINPDIRCLPERPRGQRGAASYTRVASAPTRVPAQRQ